MLSVLQFLWYGDSTYDAWLNIVAAKLASRLLTFPQSTAQMGLPSAIVYLVALSAMGLWTHSIINVMYLKHKQNSQASDESLVFSMFPDSHSLFQQSDHERTTRNSHTTQVLHCFSCTPASHYSSPLWQLHEVIGGLLGRRWRAVSLLFNLVTMFYVSSAQLIASSNVGYGLNQKLDKRTWTCVFGSVFSLSVFFPSAHNYRMWSFIGVITIIFDSAYLTLATLLHPTDPTLTHSAPRGYQEYFTGLGGLLLIGNVPIPVEIMDAMRKPEEYQRAYLYGMICIFLVAAIPSIAMERKFGDKLLTTPNALLVLPKSKFHDTANALMLVHVFINFGMYSIFMYTLWEKALGVHESPNYYKRTISRLPVFAAFWFTALAVPFFGNVNKLLDAVLVTWNFYIIPCAAYIVAFWPAKERFRSKPFSRVGWATDFSVSLGIILWMLIVECGLAFWADLDTFLTLKGSKLFAKCNNC